MTLRQVVRLSDGRQRAEWGRVASLAAQIHKTMTGERIDPNVLIPERYREERCEQVKTPEQIEHENRLAWGYLNSFFTRG
jgi:hypothetical protein